MTEETPSTPQPQPPPPGYGYAMPHQQGRNGLGTAALVLGILSIVLFILTWIDLILGILAIIFGSIGIQRANRGEATNKISATAGLVCGIVGVVIVIILVAAAFSVYNN